MHGAHHWVSSLAANLGTPRLSSHETYRRFVSVTGKPGGGLQGFPPAKVGLAAVQPLSPPRGVLQAEACTQAHRKMAETGDFPRRTIIPLGSKVSECAHRSTTRNPCHQQGGGCSARLDRPARQKFTKFRKKMQVCASFRKSLQYYSPK